MKYITFGRTSFILPSRYPSRVPEGPSRVGAGARSISLKDLATGVKFYAGEPLKGVPQVEGLQLIRHEKTKALSINFNSTATLTFEYPLLSFRRLGRLPGHCRGALELNLRVDLGSNASAYE